jgi:hypothetical protein
LPDEVFSDASPEPEVLSQFPARTTLAPPALSNMTPFDHYKAGPAPAPRDDPYIHIHRKLGISAETFDERLNQEVEELLQEIEEERMASTSHTQQEAGPVERVLTEDECYRMLRDKELTFGSMLGMYKWAVGLDRAKWNFEPKWVWESLCLLDAYL